MLFNSFEFIFLFLPITAFLYFLLVRKLGQEFGLGLLVVASLFLDRQQNLWVDFRICARVRTYPKGNDAVDDR